MRVALAHDDALRGLIPFAFVVAGQHAAGDIPQTKHERERGRKVAARPLPAVKKKCLDGVLGDAIPEGGRIFVVVSQIMLEAANAEDDPTGGTQHARRAAVQALAEFAPHVQRAFGEEKPLRVPRDVLEAVSLMEPRRPLAP